MSRPEEDVVNIAKSIADNYEDEKFRDIISDVLLTTYAKSSRSPSYNSG